MITVVTLYDGGLAESYVHVVNGQLTPEQRDEWRKVHRCDDHYDGSEDDPREMYFRELPGMVEPGQVVALENVNGE
jgi:hypothetical protein